MYDNEESVCGIIYNNVPYYFQKNLQGDIIGIVNKNAEIVARYSYDACGVPTILQDTSENGIGSINPFRYRGYYYDNETGLYYVSSRYYDPKIGRFLNSDDATLLGVSNAILSYNLFSYCENNAVNNEDASGMISFDSIKNMILAPINALINKVKDMINKIKVTYQNGLLTISTGVIAIAIDAISFAISKISHFAVKTGLKILIAWAKNNTMKFFLFAKQYIIDNAINIVLSFLNFLCRKMAISVIWSKFTNKVGNALFGTSKLYKIYNAFSSLGNIIATVFDLFDGKWDDKLAIKIS